MTVKVGEPKYIGPYKLSKLSPVLASNYYDHLIHDSCASHFVEPWDQMLGFSLVESIASLKKALDKKNGIEEKDTKDLYHMQID